MAAILPDKMPTLGEFLKEDNIPTNNLINTSQMGLLDKVKSAIDNGADINAKDKTIGHTALINATINGDIKMVEYLVGAGAKVDLGDDTKVTPLMYAAWYGHHDLVRYFLGKTRNRTIQDVDGEDALFNAVSGDTLDTKMMKILVDSGAFDVNTKNNDGNTPIFKALLLDNDRVVKALVDRGADVEIKNRDGKTIMDQAKMLKKNKILKYLNSIKVADR